MRLQRLALLAALFAVLLGCRQSSSSIHGNTTYKGGPSSAAKSPSRRRPGKASR